MFKNTTATWINPLNLDILVRLPRSPLFFIFTSAFIADNVQAHCAGDLCSFGALKGFCILQKSSLRPPILSKLRHITLTDVLQPLWDSGSALPPCYYVPIFKTLLNLKKCHHFALQEKKKKPVSKHFPRVLHSEFDRTAAAAALHSVFHACSLQR